MSKKMVSESSILGKSSLIFITVGTTHFSFTRLFKEMDQLLTVLHAEAKVIVQTLNHYQWNYKNVKIYKELSPTEMLKIIQKADKIITHGGFGTMHTISEHSSCMPLIIARQAQYGEHVDDHQVKFIQFCKNKTASRYQHYFVTEVKLKDLIKKFLLSKPVNSVLKKTIFNSQDKNKLENNLKNYID